MTTTLILILVLGILTGVSVGLLFVYKLLVKFELRDGKIEEKIDLASLRIEKLRKSLDNVHKRIDSIFVVDPKPSPNKVTQKAEDSIEFSQNNPLNLPKNVKFEVEGGDTTIPPNYS